MNAARGLSIVVAVAIAGWCAAARGADLAGELEKLFDVGTKNTPPAVAAARAQYDRLKRARPTDPRVDYAYGVVLVNQHKYRDALVLVARYLAAHEDDLDAVRTQLWAQVQEKRYLDVAAAATALARRFPQPAGEPPPDDYSETAELLGAIFGYLELVRSSAADARPISDRKNEVLAALAKGYLAAFDRGRDVVANRLAQFRAELDAKQEQAAAAARERDEKTKAALHESRQQVNEEKETIQGGTEQLRDAQRELNVIGQQLASLNQDRARLSAQIVAVQAQASTIYSSPGQPWKVDNEPFTPRSNYVGDLPNPRDPRNFQLAALSFVLAGLNKQAFDLDRRILDLQARAAELNGDGAQAARLLAESQALAAKAEKRAATLEKQLARAKKPDALRAAPPTGRAAQFSTYAPFPYEREKERVLGWFAE